MNREYTESNNRQRERLLSLVGRLTDKELNLILYPEGWTIAVALTHIAFWDMRRVVLLKKWRKEGVSPSPSDDDVFNDTTLPFFLKLAPREAAQMAAATAVTLDRELEQLSPETVAAIEALGDKHGLNRGLHRKMHLDDIEDLLRQVRR
jgi:hypothetical protein